MLRYADDESRHLHDVLEMLKSPSDVLEPPRESEPFRSQAHKVRPSDSSTSFPSLVSTAEENSRPRVVCRLDDEIFEHAKTDFPELFEEPYERITKLDEEWMKSKEGKERWRKFIES